MEANFRYRDEILYTAKNFTLPINQNDILYIKDNYYKVKLIVKYPEENLINYHFEYISFEED